MAEKPIIVEKYGSSSLTNEQGMNSLRIDGYARRVAELHKSFGIVIVSSGAISTGESIWRDMFPMDMLPNDQTLATLGSGEAFTVWQRALRKKHIASGQLLISHRELDDKKEGPMFKQTLRNNLGAGLISICNENDAVSDEEVKTNVYGGDNDGLASHIAIGIGASFLMLRTDVPGVLDADGQLVTEIGSANLDDAYGWVNYTPGTKPENSMASKLVAAHEAAAAGIASFICKSSDSFQDVLERRAGTLLLAA